MSKQGLLVNARRPITIVAVASLFILCLLACQKEATEMVPTPKMAVNPPIDAELQTRGAKEGVRYMLSPVGQYRGKEEARNHHCIDQDPPIHAGFWQLAYTSAYRAVGRLYVDDNWDAEGNIVEGRYLDPANIESVEVRDATFGKLHGGRRVLSLSLRLWVTDFQKIPGGVDGGYFYHSAEGYMDEETCEITYFRSW